MNAVVDPSTILTREDYETPRTLEELSTWWHKIHGRFGETREGIIYVREDRGLSKRLYGEAQPMLQFMRRHPPAPDIRCQLFDGHGKADCVYLDRSGSVVRRFQITRAVEGRTEKLRLRQLTRVGHVDALAALDENDEIPESTLPFNHHTRVIEMAGKILEAIEKKVSKCYDPDFTLIVGFDDSSFDQDDVPMFRANLVMPSHNFSEVHIVGQVGRVAWS